MLGNVCGVLIPFDTTSALYTREPIFFVGVHVYESLGAPYGKFWRP
jgi:hypothetical protein